MSPANFDEQFATFLRLATDLCKSTDADALLIMLEAPVDWKTLKKKTTKQMVVLAADSVAHLEGAEKEGFGTVVVNLSSATFIEKLNQALLDGVAKELLSSGSDVVAMYSAFEKEGGEVINSLSLLRLDERLGKLSARDLRRLETQVPLETLKTVVDLAVEIGREGREGKAVGTMMVVGDHSKVLKHSRTIGFDPVKGYKQAERNLREPSVREAIKEIALMDGAFVISSTGIVVAACQLLETGGTGSITLSKGLGTRHWAGAAISKKTKTIAVVVSESNGSVRIFQDGQVMLRIEPAVRPGARPFTFRELNPADPSEDEKPEKKSDGKKADKDDKRKDSRQEGIA